MVERARTAIGKDTRGEASLGQAGVEQAGGLGKAAVATMSRALSHLRRAPLRAGMAAVAAGLALCAVGGVRESRAANLLELNFWLSGPNYSGDVPACGEQQALDLIASRFAETERRFWNSDLSITGFEKIHEIAFRPWGPEYQPRRYCRGTVFTTDARKRAIYYSIIEAGSFIGATWGVEWCVVGLDRNYAYAPSCKMAGP